MFRLFKKKKAEQIDLSEILKDYELPSFPSTVMNLLSLLRDPYSDMEEISRFIEIDPGMNVRVLRLVNSAAFGIVQKITNVHHAVMMLGKARIESVVLSIAVKTCIPTPRVRCFDMEEFWRISARRAVLARLIAHQIHPLTEVEAFTAGLLQDMAVPVLVESKKEHYCRLWQEYLDSNTNNLSEIERDRLGYDHQSVGALMAERWELPEYFVKSIAGHHDGRDVDAAVHIVSFLREYDGPEENEMLFKVAETEFGIGKEEMKRYLESSFNDAEELINLLQ